MMRYKLTDFEWAAIRSFLPNKLSGTPVLATGAVATSVICPTGAVRDWVSSAFRKNIFVLF